ncbi:hypothetical protein GO986_12220 [Deinococcus sp. HMF7620]|uniref:Uncharacterized protein n=1 Tax=Deinococcus arboris TaxID=2682977 RepID=A0A7C9I3J6_9DEIO|nr:MULTISPECIES: hypothetical protein [Deinococcus]MBZ9752216.1 hypothetical protein [Deinococcus betulae]MVN87531.1 hypothetical protein [Deinococcus arboris]
MTVDGLTRFDRAFDAAAAVCVAVRVPLAREGVWLEALRASGLSAEQSEADDTHLTCYVRPNIASHLMTALLFLGTHHGTVTLPNTERGQQIAAWLPRSQLSRQAVSQILSPSPHGQRSRA